MNQIQKGDIVKHRLNNKKMVVYTTTAACPQQIGCRWYNEENDEWKDGYFDSAELVIFKSFPSEK